MIEGVLSQPSIVGLKERPPMKKGDNPKMQGAQKKDLL
jgi:hypothetical protein